jgi:hypothetical protein
VLEASIAAMPGPRPELRCFPPVATYSVGAWEQELGAVLGGLDHVVAIERAGPARDGRYYTMSMKDMTHLLAPLDRLMGMAALARPPIGSTGIGDGGNEVGMGKVGEQVRANIKNGATIACTTQTDHLVTCSVSNWGGYV